QHCSWFAHADFCSSNSLTSSTKHFSKLFLPVTTLFCLSSKATAMPSWLKCLRTKAPKESVLADFLSSDRQLLLFSRFPSSKTLYVLDSSFNPPTLAHLEMAKSVGGPVLLLLSTRNADKGAIEREIKDRIEMMQILANIIGSCIIGLIKAAKFVEKEHILRQFGREQIFIVGYDTLVRILDPKYYPDGLRSELSDFFKRARIICKLRNGIAGEREQLDIIERIRLGKADIPGEWADRIEIKKYGDSAVISSTAVRNACAQGDIKKLEELVPEAIAKFVLRKNMYGHN
ncbi:putative nicotinamide mononucleotide adenylyltransferase, partial [Neolecta irregularis DAH-3]